MQNNNQNQENASNRMEQGKAQQDKANSNEQESNFENPQQGSNWDNYQTRTLSAEGGNEGHKITQEEVEQAIKSSEQDKSSDK